MGMFGCFTVDLSARSADRLSTFQLLKRFIFNPGYRVLVYYRFAMALRRMSFPRRTSSVFASLILVRLARVPGVEFQCSEEIGAGLLMCHPHDIVIGAGSRIGRRVTIYNSVTLGARVTKAIDASAGDDERYPVIEDDVTIFPGARIIGFVTIGKNSIVAANAVVTKSFPPNSVIGGIPAKLIGTRDGEGPSNSIDDGSL
ncbi:MAG: serine acetyltransferase [Phycisphaerae bacterium]|nr:MAG: serine acetyltransferase [Phycisphaerae bacterium]